tara:strand:+ start:882 stop:1151 length:270 start_codon:yes stop_codon:yes gene_type:complete
MKKKETPIILDEKWLIGATDTPRAHALEMFEVTEADYIENPFPLSLDAQKRLLELIYNRKSGIITRQELIDVLFNPEDVPKGTIIRCLI